jgi:hypothetical protein
VRLLTTGVGCNSHRRRPRVDPASTARRAGQQRELLAHQFHLLRNELRSRRRPAIARELAWACICAIGRCGLRRFLHGHQLVASATATTTGATATGAAGCACGGSVSAAGTPPSASKLR